MAKKGSSYHCPPKSMPQPADVRALEHYGKLIMDQIRLEYKKMMGPPKGAHSAR